MPSLSGNQASLEISHCLPTELNFPQSNGNLVELPVSIGILKCRLRRTKKSSLQNKLNNFWSHNILLLFKWDISFKLPPQKYATQNIIQKLLLWHIVSVCHSSNRFLGQHNYVTFIIKMGLRKTQGKFGSLKLRGLRGLVCVCAWERKRAVCVLL